MIILNDLSWSNAFSYGDNNSVSLSNMPLTQIIGKNGHGKSSIALILEEVLYNKNSKGIKKGNILNRHNKAKSYQIRLSFTKNNIDEYVVETNRSSSSQTVKLTKNGVDISSHTSTATYATIENIVGLDHKTFAQLVYQSHSASLEFLRSPDTARKKFLIELLDLGKYTKIGDVFKTKLSEVSKELGLVHSKIEGFKEWVQKYSALDFTRREIYIVQNLQENIRDSAKSLEDKLLNIDSTNKKITQNNTYKSILNCIILPEVTERPTDYSQVSINNIGRYEKTIQDAKQLKQKMVVLKDMCPMCMQSIDKDTIDSIITEQNNIIVKTTHLKQAVEEELKELNVELEKWLSDDKLRLAWEKYHSLIDSNLPTELLDGQELSLQLNQIKQEISEFTAKNNKLIKLNQDNTVHNSKLDLLETQLEDVTNNLNELQNTYKVLNSRHAILSILTKTFSTVGLVAYKIESLITGLEELSNEYLGELSDGRFQISFKITESDKLSVIISDNGTDIEISALSVGEFARVNVSVLLAIRRLMQSISDAKINLLFLDETISTLDIEGKERLVETLLEEEDLNVFLVSHELTHPLVSKLNVVKHRNISSIIEE